MYTQYQFNMLALNPAYAGSRDALTGAILHRAQWVGIEGAPKTTMISLHSPVISQQLGAGLSVFYDAIGPVSTTALFADFSGRVQVGSEGWLAGGLKLGLNFHQANFTSLSLDQSGDFEFGQNTQSVLPNIGFGLYYYTPTYFVGMSMPRVFQNEIYQEDNSLLDARERRHYFLNGGLLIPVGTDVEFKPSFLMRLVESAPLSVDVNAAFIFSKTIWVGVNYRWQESLGLLLAYQITNQVRFGYSYDHITSDLQPYSNGSHEVSLVYDLVLKPSKIRSPRYF